MSNITKATESAVVTTPVLELPKYFVGEPKTYRYDGKSGYFKLYETPLKQQLKFQPVAWRFYEDDLFQMGRKLWAEIFFVDDANCLSVIMFHGYNVENFRKTLKPYRYDDLTYADLTYTVEAVKKNGEKGAYWQPIFKAEKATKEQAAYAKFVAEKLHIYNAETARGTGELIEMANMKFPENTSLPQIEAGDEGYDESPAETGEVNKNDLPF